MDPSNDVPQFLSSRWARIAPEQAGLPSYGTRRVPGLSREEVASLAGVSVEYYKRLEQANLSGVSDLVLEGLANALALDDAEREHLSDLARAAGAVAPHRRRSRQRGVRPNVQRILDALDIPAVARAVYGDYVAANVLGRALYAPLFDSPEQPANSASFTFLDPAATAFYVDWDQVTSDLVAHLRSEAGHDYRRLGRGGERPGPACTRVMPSPEGPLRDIFDESRRVLAAAEEEGLTVRPIGGPRGTRARSRWPVSAGPGVKGHRSRDDQEAFTRARDAPREAQLQRRRPVQCPPRPSPSALLRLRTPAAARRVRRRIRDVSQLANRRPVAHPPARGPAR